MAPAVEARFARETLGLERAGFSFQRLAPDARMPFGHRHREQEELYVVVEGGGRVALDDEVVEVEQWDAVRVAPETMRCFEAGPDGLTFLVFGSPYTGPGDADLAPGWWGGQHEPDGSARAA
ncbi:MAG TPA: cupin domain-containing protein [Gaiellaceae bacterium]|nr:cupin domain-containing protein [Gaiellaceae bacterium]